MKYYVIIPAHNEANYIKSTINSLLNQTLLPQKVVVVNDHSTDETEQIIDAYVQDHPFIQKVNTYSSTFHLPGSKIINAFYKGYQELDKSYDFIVKLDADIVLPLNYFEKVAALFNKHPKTGIVGGMAYEQNSTGEWNCSHPMDQWHVRGAFKSYSNACFNAIGGLKKSIGWDTVDELLAFYRGFEVTCDKHLAVKQLRPVGAHYSKEAISMQGEAMYKMRYGFLLTCIASLKMGWQKKNTLVFIHNLSGYFNSFKNRTPKLVSKKEGKFIRNFRNKSMIKKLAKVFVSS